MKSYAVILCEKRKQDCFDRVNLIFKLIIGKLFLGVVFA